MTGWDRALAGEPWYPEAPAGHGGSGGFEDPAVLRPPDLGRAWHRDFHYPRGVVPLGAALVADLVRGAQQAVRTLRLSASGGLAARFVGPYVYLGTVRADPPSAAERAAALADVRGYPARFRGHWAAARAELEARLRELEQAPVEDFDPPALGAYLARAWQVHARAWQVHFEVMYRLLASHELIRDELAGLGVDGDELLRLLHAEDNSVLAGDRALSALAASARRAGLAHLFTEHSGPLLPRLARHEAAAAWLAEFREFLAVYGQRCDALGDLTRPSWVEDPEQPLALVRMLLLGRAGGLPARGAALVEDARRANVVWWNEEHNLVIDLRAHLPIRRAALALAAATGAPEPDAVLFLFAEEADRLAHGLTGWAELAGLVAARRAYYQAWRERREELPSFLGTPAADEGDPVVKQIISAGWCGAGSAPGETPRVLRGLGVSCGTARGRVRVLRSPDDLASLRPGEVLVCEATSPSWTPVFSLLAACVCDVGGMLTHAATISREYGIPCVCDVGSATRDLRDGDEVEVDGTNGTVTLLARPDPVR